MIREDTTTILKLQKQKVAAQLAENAGLDVVDLLARLSGKPLPQNVVVELEEWAGHADAFTLYEGFGLVEYPGKLRQADPFTAQRIGNSLRLVRDPEGMLRRLREANAVVLSIHHRDDELRLLPERARTVFPRKASAAQAQKRKARQPVTLKRESLIALYFPDEALFERFRKALLDAGCVFEAHKEQRRLVLPGQYQAQIKAAIKQLSSEYKFSIEDLQ